MCRALCFGQEIDFSLSPRLSHSLIPRRVSFSRVAYILSPLPTPPFGYHRSRPTAGPGDGFPDRKNSIHFRKPKPCFLDVFLFSIHHYTYIHTSLECVYTIDVQRYSFSCIFFVLYFKRVTVFFSAKWIYVHIHTHLNPYYIPYS